MRELIPEALGVRNTCLSVAFLWKIAHFSTLQIRLRCETICRAGSKRCCRSTGRKQESMTFPPLCYNRELSFWWNKTKIEFIFMHLDRDVSGGIKCDSCNNLSFMQNPLPILHFWLSPPSQTYIAFVTASFLILLPSQPPSLHPSSSFLDSQV